MNCVYSIIWAAAVFATTWMGIFVLSKKTDYLLAVSDTEQKLCGMKPTLFNKIFIITATVSASICGFFRYEDGMFVTDNIILIFAFSALSLAAVTDIHSHRIPNFIPISMIFTRVLLFIVDRILQREDKDWALRVLSSFGIALLMFLVFYCMSRAMHGGVGFGDVKIITALTFMLGVKKGFLLIFISLILCALVSIVLLLKKSKKLKDEIPFGPFLFVANIIFLLFMYDLGG